MTTTETPGTDELAAAAHTDDLARVARVARDLLAEKGARSIDVGHLTAEYANRTGTPLGTAHQRVRDAYTYGYLETERIDGMTFVRPALPTGERQAADLFDLRCQEAPQEPEPRHNRLAEHCQQRGSAWLEGQRCLTCQEAPQEPANAPRSADQPPAGQTPADDEPEPATYALALMRSTLLNTEHPADVGNFTPYEADAVCAALAPQVRRMLANADARVNLAKTAATIETRTECYAGAADEAGDPLATPTPEQWLRRLFDLPTGRRLDVARATIALAGQASRCFEQNHVKRIVETGLQHGEALARAESAEAALEDARARHAADVREARRTAAERSWDAAADSLLAEDPTIAAMLKAANPHSTTEPQPEGTDPL